MSLLRWRIEHQPETRLGGETARGSSPDRAGIDLELDDRLWAGFAGGGERRRLDNPSLQDRTPEVQDAACWMELHSRSPLNCISGTNKTHIERESMLVIDWRCSRTCGDSAEVRRCKGKSFFKNAWKVTTMT